MRVINLLNKNLWRHINICDKHNNMTLSDLIAEWITTKICTEIQTKCMYM